MIAESTNCLKLKNTESQAQVFQDILRTQGDLSGSLNLAEPVASIHPQVM